MNITLDEIIEALDKKTDIQRLAVFHRYCCHCGSKDPGCQCWNDE